MTARAAATDKEGRPVDHRRRSDVCPRSASVDPAPSSAAPPTAPLRRPSPRRAAEPENFADAAADHGEPQKPRTELSRRESEVLRLLAEGKTDQEIAEELQVSYRTVTTHVGRVYAKLGVRSRAAAAVQAVRRGLA